jgi:hypothetical protein
MHFQHNISVLLGRMEGRWRVEFTWGNGSAAAAPRRGWEVVATRLEEGNRWQGRQPSAAARHTW